MKRFLVSLVILAAIGFGLIPPAEEVKATTGYYAVIEISPDARSVSVNEDSTTFLVQFDINDDGSFDMPVYLMGFDLQADAISDSGVATLLNWNWLESNFPNGGSAWSFRDNETTCSGIGYVDASTNGQSGDPWETSNGLTGIAQVTIGLDGFVAGDSLIVHFWDDEPGQGCVASRLLRVQSTSPLVTHADDVDGNGAPHTNEYSGDVDGSGAYCPGDAGEIHGMWGCLVITFTTGSGGGGGGGLDKSGANTTTWSEVKDKYQPKELPKKKLQQ